MNKYVFAKYRLIYQLILLLGIGLLGGLPALASGGGGSGPAEGVNYIAITPPLVVNYGGPGKARFIKAELSLRAENAADTTQITHHLPLIRDKLISILSAQTEAVISTPEGKENLRLHALAEINKALHIVEHGDEQLANAEDAIADDSKKDGQKKKPAKDKNKDKKAKESSADSDQEHKKPAGPASDLLFNNFVVQK